ncbi:MAG: hypothetical protein HRU13_13865 [Phycisphaerales bacterium]|nr:hypothetical protein [Phycisphaerales bacterium]
MRKRRDDLMAVLFGIGSVALVALLVAVVLMDDGEPPDGYTVTYIWVSNGHGGGFMSPIFIPKPKPDAIEEPDESK